jgi:signal transduction histidine kinase
VLIDLALSGTVIAYYFYSEGFYGIELRTVVATLAGVSLLFRRRFVVVVALLACVDLQVNPFSNAYPIVVYTLVSQARWWLLATFAMQSCALNFATSSILLSDYLGYNVGGMPVRALNLEAVLVNLVTPVSLGLTALVRRRMIDGLSERAARLERERLLVERNAKLHERSRMADEMHDMIGHRLSLISIHAGVLELQSPAAEPSVGSTAILIRDVAGTALDELGKILSILRVDVDPAGNVQPPDDAGRRADIDRLVRESQNAGIAVGLEWFGDDVENAPLQVRWALHRVVREGLTNIHRHAPDAPATVAIRHDADKVQAQIDSGPPNPGGRLRPGSGSGLVGLNERARLLGGSVNAGKRDDGGFTVVAVLPTTSPHGSDGPIPPSADVARSPAVSGDHADRAATNMRRASRHRRPAPRWEIPARVFAIAFLLIGLTVYNMPIQAARIDSSSLSAAEFAGLTPAQTRADVDRLVIDEGSAVVARLGIAEPSAPRGATCVYGPSPSDVNIAYRVCLRDDRLVEKREFQALVTP